MAEDFDTTLYDDHPATLAHPVEAYRMTVTSVRPLRAVLTMVTKDGLRCDTLLTQEDAEQIAGTLASFAEMKRNDPRIQAALQQQELEAVVPYGPH
jgi:hypothetical protein